MVFGKAYYNSYNYEYMWRGMAGYTASGQYYFLFSMLFACYATVYLLELIS